MTLEQLQTLVTTLEVKVDEGLEKLKETPINSPSFSTILNNIIASTTLASKIKNGGTSTPTQSEKGEA